MELHELVERIQRWKERQAAERGETPEGGYEEAAQADEYVESVDEAAEFPEEVEAEAVEEVEAEAVEEVEPEAVEEVEAEAVEEVEAEAVEEIEPEAAEEAAEEDDGEDHTSEVDLDQIEELEEV